MTIIAYGCPFCGHTLMGGLCPQCGLVWLCRGCGMWLSKNSDHDEDECAASKFVSPPTERHAEMKILVPECPWCGVSLVEQVKEKEHNLGGHVTTCDNCKRQIKLTGDTVITVTVEKVPHLHAVPDQTGKDT